MRRRAGWFRCPRCREILPEEVHQQDAATSSIADSPGVKPRTAAWVWAAAGSAIVGAASAIAFMAANGATAPDHAAGVGQSQNAGAARPADSSAPAGRGGPGNVEVASAYAGATARRTGDAAYAQGDLDRARAEYEAAVAANPDDAEARNNLAQVLMRQNQPAIALLHLDEAVRLNSQKWAYRFNRARAYGDSSRLTEAVEEYKAAAQLFPEDYATQYNLGLTQMKLKQYAGAAEALEQAVKLAPGDPSLLITLGTAYVGADKADRAKATFEEFLKLAPGDPEVARIKDLLAALEAASRTKN